MDARAHRPPTVGTNGGQSDGLVERMQVIESAEDGYKVIESCRL